MRVTEELECLPEPVADIRVNDDKHAKPPFEAVVARHGATVLRVVRAVVGHADADDAWSDTFLAALKAYPQLPADANIEAWLVTIAHRKAIDITRTASRRAVPVGDPPDSPARERADTHDLDLYAAVGALPPKQRRAVAYHYLAGTPLLRDRGASRQQRCRRPARRGRRDRHPPTHLSPYRHREESPMTTYDLTKHFPVDPDQLRRLHARLERNAQAGDLLDIAYRTVDSVVGPLLLAATPRGLLRVAFANEDHDSVLQDLASRISPRVLEASTRLDPIVRQLDEYLTGRRHSFDVALDWSLSHGFRRTVLEHLNADIGYRESLHVSMEYIVSS